MNHELWRIVEWVGGAGVALIVVVMYCAVRVEDGPVPTQEPTAPEQEQRMRNTFKGLS